jgi:hypothetical protein
MFRLYVLMVAEKMSLPPTIVPITISTLNDVEPFCGTDYRFRTRDHLRRVMLCLRLPTIITLENGSKILRERAFLYFIRRMAFVGTVQQLMTLGFGGDAPLWGRVLKYMAKHIADTLGFKLEPSNIGFFEGRHAYYSEAIQKKANEYHATRNPGAPPLFPVAGSMLPFAMLDGNCTGTCTPGTGPSHPGPGAPRHPGADLLQMAFYTGWLHKHGIKHLTLDGPDGLALFCWGPASIRRNDLWLLANSGANYYVEQSQPGVLPAARHVMYGDSIFPWRTCLRSRYHASVADPAKAWKDDVDSAMSSGRQCVEHHYGEADQLWPFMAFHKKLIIKNMDLASLYTAKMLLRNFYVCLYGNKTSERFGCKPPELEVYAN